MSKPLSESLSASGSESKSKKVLLGHEKLDVYRLVIDYVAWVYKTVPGLKGIHRHARDQWLRASQSIPLNIAEGNGKASKADRRRYFEIARGSALECAAIQDVLVVGNALEKMESREHKIKLDRIAAMLSRMGGRSYCIAENLASYDAVLSSADNDPDSDPDTDPDSYSDSDKKRRRFLQRHKRVAMTNDKRNAAGGCFETA